MIAGELVDEARDYHPAFDDRLISNRMALRQLTAAQRSFVREVTALNEEAFAIMASLSQEGVAEALEGGYVEFPPHILILDASIKDKHGQVYPIDVLPYPTRHDPDCPPAVWLRGQAMRLSDGRQNYGSGKHGWEDVEELLIHVVLDPPAVEAMGSELHLPDPCRDALMGRLVGFMAGRAEVDTAAIGLADSHWASAVHSFSMQSSTAARYVHTRVN